MMSKKKPPGQKVYRDPKTGKFIKQQEKDKSGTVLVTAVGGAILGNLIAPGIGGAVVGALLGGALGANSSKEDDDE
ncbi:hypothetical protein [Spongiibacter sp.]|uniref:hypothetical protein n=1 Tax=Spongiibacter sp. TaxID=2024860 RepID=UPI001B102787|nr:hypothetical protein [Spongiibacter sp.]MBO6754602.1 hypothetical protein [Spongiibacter sp.]|tara:strand:- start:5454 stop:5681 length:228 start_codon:yes stop_codon:yes gene_type:complete